MRPPILRLHDEDLIIDSFAGGGGASLGIEMALGRSPDIAVNHDEEAVAMHQANHPATHHLCGDVWHVKPKEVCQGRRIALAWFSPDCKHFSVAKGGKPVEKGIRALAWVVVRWARDVKPRCIILENVQEFADWGPLGDDDRPDPARKGVTFRRWWASLEAAGYRVEMRLLRACDYGAPTTRKRLFVIARSDGLPIVWPEPTHGPGRAEPYHVAAECIEWSVPTVSIFATKKEGRAFGVVRPLAKNTMARIGRGVWKYVIGSKEPFVVRVAGGRLNDAAPYGISTPLHTVTAAHRGEIALVAPTLVQTGYGERPGQAPRVLDLQKPLTTIISGGTGGNGKHALCAAYLAKHYGDPARKKGGGVVLGQALGDTLGTVTVRDHHAIVLSHMVKLMGTCRDGQAWEAPFPTVRAGGNHLGEVRTFLTKFYGTATGQTMAEPVGTLTTKDRFGLVTVAGEDYAIADIGMRMLIPRELFRAQGFPDRYRIEVEHKGKVLSKTAQVRMCGNSVSPHVACALVTANVAKKAQAVA